MTRTKFRQFWIVVVGVMLMVASYAHNHSKDIAVSIDRANKTRDKLDIEFRTGNQMTSALVELDGVTIDENEATRLEILRYLGIESSDLVLQTQAPIIRKMVGTDLYVRRFTIKGMKPYAEALDQIDLFYNLKKVTVYSVQLDQVKGYDDNVSFELKGAIYGLQK